MNALATSARVVLLLALLPASADAAGYFLPVRGVRPSGRAAAVTAQGAGAWSLWFNPAQMTELGGTHLMLDAALTGTSTTFERTPRLLENGDVVTYPSVSNDKPPDVIPALVLTSDFGVDGLAVGIGLMPPYGARSRYPEDGPQRYSLISNENAASAVVALGVAFQITDWLALGASFQNIFFNTELVLMGSAYAGVFGEPEDSDLDILMSIHSTDSFAPTGNLGIWADLTPGLRFALAFQLPAIVEDGDAALQVRLPSHPFFDSAAIEGDTVRGRFELPSGLRAGLSYQLPEGDIELDVFWEGWSVHDVIQTTPDDVTITGLFHVDELVVAPLDVPMEWEDTFGLALGGDWRVLPDLLTVRAGLGYEQSAVPDQRLSVFKLDLEKVTLAGGFSVHVPSANLVIDFAVVHVFHVERAVTDSQVEQINAAYRDGALVVGNGRYQAAIDIVGVGVDFGF